MMREKEVMRKSGERAPVSDEKVRWSIEYSGGQMGDDYRRLHGHSDMKYFRYQLNLIKDAVRENPLCAVRPTLVNNKLHAPLFMPNSNLKTKFWHKLWDG